VLALKKLNFVVSLMVAENDYQQEQASAAREAAERLGAEIEIIYAGNDAVVQGQQLLEVLQSSGRRPDGIVCHPVGTSLVQVARVAASAGIGWAILNREGDYIPELRKTCKSPVFAVTVDQHEVGAIQGRQFSKLLPEGGLALYIAGPTANPALKTRIAAMESCKPANIQLRMLPAKMTEQSGYEAVVNWLKLSTSRSSPVKLVAAQNDNMVMGARKALVERSTGEEREAWSSRPYVGCDACPNAGQKWVRQGLLTASVFLPPSAGRAIEMLASAIESGEQPPERTLLTPTPFPRLETLAASAVKSAS
jgi:ABC-type sugar transport system substrate-binding protein